MIYGSNVRRLQLQRVDMSHRGRLWATRDINIVKMFRGITTRLVASKTTQRRGVFVEDVNDDEAKEKETLLLFVKESPKELLRWVIGLETFLGKEY